MTANTRVKIGIALAVGGNLLFFTSAWIAWMPWSPAFKAGLWSVLFFAPEAGTLAGIAVMGRENYDRFKAILIRWLLKAKPAGNISRTRHLTGLVLFCLPIVPRYIQAYHPQWLPDSSSLRWQANLLADLLFLASLFVLGGNFWDKLYALFQRGPLGASASAEPPRISEETTNTPADSH